MSLLQESYNTVIILVLIGGVAGLALRIFLDIMSGKVKFKEKNQKTNQRKNRNRKR